MKEAIVKECGLYKKDETQKYIGQLVKIKGYGNGSYLCKCEDGNIYSFAYEEIEVLEKHGPIDYADNILYSDDVEHYIANKTTVWVKINQTDMIPKSTPVEAVVTNINCYYDIYITVICTLSNKLSNGHYGLSTVVREVYNRRHASKQKRDWRSCIYLNKPADKE